MLGCLSLILITNLTNLMTYPVINSSTNTTSCYTANNVSLANDLIACLMRIFIPFGTMLTLNLVVIYRLRRSKTKVGVATTAMMNIGPKPQSSQVIRSAAGQLTSKELRFTVSTLTIDFVFLFFYLPLGIAYAIVIYNLFDDSIKSSMFDNAIFNLFSSISQLLAMSHTSVTIFIFVIFNRYFRAELIRVFRVYVVFPNLQPMRSTNMTRMNNNHVSKLV